MSTQITMDLCRDAPAGVAAALESDQAAGQAGDHHDVRPLRRGGTTGEPSQCHDLSPRRYRGHTSPGTVAPPSDAPVADRLRHMLIGYARVSKTDGSQSLDLQEIRYALVRLGHGVPACPRRGRTPARRASRAD